MSEQIPNTRYTAKIKFTVSGVDTNGFDVTGPISIVEANAKAKEYAEALVSEFKSEMASEHEVEARYEILSLEGKPL